MHRRKNEENIHEGITRMIDLRAAGIETWEIEDVKIEVQTWSPHMHCTILKITTELHAWTTSTHA